ncbi:peptidoglycan DD-metalloendopeptidase family protein [Vibrio algicola]|uniref:Peptidoglycan DD-metalloendopeptidase family protein n=1 Tax=Vibrio algicola TaxID=2662262 RepID=A0A5Q0TL39_9VIBR|nr:peptidoglycan DD-metalloendopeptidase family protein [Vibrio algicola]
MTSLTSASLAQQLAQTTCHPVLPKEFQFGIGLIVDLSATSDIWGKVTAGHSFADEIKRQAQVIQAKVEIGRYAEERTIYQDTDNFSDSQARTMHIGIDLGVPTHTPVFAPLDGKIFGFADHQTQGDYGPTIILCHQLDGLVFHTLYGHLSRDSLADLFIGKSIQQGEQFARIGASNENGGWASHLHLQIIQDMGNHTDDYPGVIDPAQADYYLNNCPNPNLILKRTDLK